MKYEYWLAQAGQLSCIKKQMLREKFGSGEAVYYIEEKELNSLKFMEKKDTEALQRAKFTKWEKEWENLGEERIQFVPYFSEDYPEKLLHIFQPPYALYLKGRLPDPEKKAAAIVGARSCTPYGEEMALEYGAKLAASGVEVISGMARGIDGAAQRGALNGSGKTYAVLGCGVNVCYPREHRGLYLDIQKEGGVLSEQLPGQPPLAAYFPARNRIISGMADVVLVIEAKERSGSLITADMALEQGRDVYALPGMATSPVSMGCHRLIRQGAGILISPEDLLREMGIEELKMEKKSDKNKKTLESPENIVYSCLGLYPKSISRLAEETGLLIPELLEQLVALELKGYIKEVSKNYYRSVR